MGSLLRSLVLSTLLLPHLLMASSAAASTSPRAHVMSQELSAERSFQPSPPGIPQRRLSGGTR
ncbi:MAG: hypothetical protein AAGA46_10950 [Cyanobacteria bacterium P01_F01_bin.13]